MKSATYGCLNRAGTEHILIQACTLAAAKVRYLGAVGQDAYLLRKWPTQHALPLGAIVRQPYVMTDLEREL